MTDITVINIGRDFSRYPVGRYRTDGDSNGEAFRDDILVPKLAVGTRVRIELDDVLGYGSSFLEEVFGGLVRMNYTEKKLEELLEIVSEDDSLIAEVKSYISDAAKEMK